MIAATQQSEGATLAEIIEAAARCALDVDQGRATPQPILEALREGGFLDCLVGIAPGEGLTAAVTIVTRLAAACPSTAWNFAIFVTHRASASTFPEEARRLMGLTATDARTPLIATALVTRHRAEVDGGGLRIAGQWDFVSGARYADWVWLATRDQTGRGCWVMVRPDELEIVPGSWNALGMRGTESATIRAVALQLPKERLVYLADIQSAANAVPNRAVISLLFGGLCLGIARGAHAAFVGATLPAEAHRLHQELSLETELELDALQALLGERLGGIGTAPCRRPSELQAAAAFIAERTAQVVFKMAQLLGTRAMLLDSRFGLLWRDLQVACSHAYVKRSIAFDNVLRARAKG